MEQAMTSNWILQHKQELQERNYIRETDGYEDSVFFEQSKVDRYNRNWSGEFNLIIVGSKDIVDDYWVLPFRSIQHMLTEETIKTQKTGRKRWQLSIRDNILRIGHLKLSVPKFKGPRLNPKDWVTIDPPLPQETASDASKKDQSPSSSQSEEPVRTQVTKSAQPTPVEVEGAGFGSPEENVLVERAAIAAVTELYTAKGWDVRSVESEGRGFDLECRRETNEENVEVKGVSGSQQCFIITAGEVQQSRANPKFVLYVVTEARSQRPTLNRYTGEEFSQRFKLAPIQYRATPVQP
jgi:hypothetical protein